jgi:protein Mpv17
MRAARRPGGANADDLAAIELQELEKKEPFQKIDLIGNSGLLPPPFNFERSLRFVAYGFLIAPIQYKWFGLLGRMFPVVKGAPGATKNVLKMVAMDQFIFAPISLSAFFTYMTVTEGGGKRAVQKKFQDLYVPSLKANYVLWPAVQLINFRLMPLQFQLVSYFPS